MGDVAPSAAPSADRDYPSLAHARSNQSSLNGRQRRPPSASSREWTLSHHSLAVAEGSVHGRHVAGEPPERLAGDRF
jgi:hypothetical protein